jgi:protein TonB
MARPLRDVLGLSLSCLLALMLCTACEKETPRARQVAKITLLPDTPPPPPPPPPKEPPPPPKAQPKEVKRDQPKQEAPPQAEQLKMEGTAGDGPSAFAAGTPTQDYTGQQLGGNGSGGLGRAEFDLYRTHLQRLLQDELARMKELKGVAYRIPIRVSRAPDAQSWKVTFAESTGDPKLDELLRTTLNNAIQKDPPPATAPSSGFAVRVTNKFLN